MQQGAGDVCREPGGGGRPDGATSPPCRHPRPGRSAENTGGRHRRCGLPERRTEQDIEKIERFLAERGATAAAGRLEACIEADIRFHVALAEATHNEILYELYRSATIHLQKGFEHIYVDTGYFLASQPTHERLVRDIIARDARKALHTIGIILKEP